MGQSFFSMLREGATRVKNFLSGIANREFLVFLFFLFVSAAFWLMETLNEDYVDEISIPVEYLNVPENVVITSDIPEEIKIKVSDKGFTLLNYLLYGANGKVKINFLDYQEKGNSVRITSSEIQKQLEKTIESSSKLVSFKPEGFEMVYTRGQAKRVPVRLKGSASAKQQYDITNISFDPDTLTIYAPEDILDTIHVVFTAPISYHELSEDITFDTEMTRPRNVKFVPEKVKVTINVSQLTEKTLEVPITAVNVPEGKIMRTFPSKVKVTFQASLADFDKIKAEEFTIHADYETIRSAGSDRCEPIVVRYPSNIKHMGVWPKEVEYLVEDE